MKKIMILKNKSDSYITVFHAGKLKTLKPKEELRSNIDLPKYALESITPYIESGEVEYNKRIPEGMDDDVLPIKEDTRFVSIKDEEEEVSISEPDDPVNEENPTEPEIVPAPEAEEVTPDPSSESNEEPEESDPSDEDESEEGPSEGPSKPESVDNSSEVAVDPKPEESESEEQSEEVGENPLATLLLDNGYRLIRDKYQLKDGRKVLKSISKEELDNPEMTEEKLRELGYLDTSSPSEEE